MARVAVIVIALVLAQWTPALADVRRGDDAFMRGDYLGAEREWRGPAEAGDASAMLGLGTLYDTGHGVRQDFTHALIWYRRAAEAGNARAMFNVGVMYDNGRGTDVDRREAIKWYARSAAKGNGRAAYAAAMMYRNGDGVPQNTSAAIRFFRIASAAGINAARVNLTSLGQSASVAATARPPAAPGSTPKSRDVEAMTAKPASGHATPAPVEPSGAIDAAASRTAPTPEPAPLPTVSTEALSDQPPPASAPVAIATATQADPPKVDPVTPEAPANLPAASIPGATDDNVVIATKGDDDGIEPPSGPIVAQEPMAARVDRFHKIALQRGDVSMGLSPEYKSVVREVAHRAMQGDRAAQFDAGFAYEHGIGVPPDLVKSYVFYVRATLSPETELETVALGKAFEVGGRLTDEQHASAADMLTRSDR